MRLRDVWVTLLYTTLMWNISENAATAPPYFLSRNRDLGTRFPLVKYRVLLRPLFISPVYTWYEYIPLIYTPCGGCWIIVAPRSPA